jgi:predicted transcriptional regulator
MKKLTIFLRVFTLIAFLTTGCISVSHISTTSGVKEDYLTNIPKGAKIVLVEKKNVSADNLYEELITILLSRGHRIIKDDKERHYITTEGKDIGQSTLQRMTLVILEKENSSQLKITTEWKGGTEASMMATAMSGIPIQADWAIAKWEINRLGIAFAESVAIANEIENGHVSYE